MVAGMKKTNPSFLNGVPELLVLRLLAGREMYGYEIVEEIRSRTGAALSFGEGCIYPYLHYLEAEKQVSSRRREVEGRSRNYYKLTARGRKRLAALTAEWNRVTTGVGTLPGGTICLSLILLANCAGGWWNWAAPRAAAADGAGGRRPPRGFETGRPAGGSFRGRSGNPRQRPTGRPAGAGRTLDGGGTPVLVVGRHSVILFACCRWWWYRCCGFCCWG